jgi:signal transduction histidine kinase
MLRIVMAIFDFSSLRGKITSAYLVLVILTVALGVIAFSDLIFVEKQVIKGEAISDLKDAVLEMRREEKNLFLYTDPQALKRIKDFLSKSEQITRDHQETLDGISSDITSSRIQRMLEQYQQKVDAWDTSLPTDSAKQTDIRSLGHKILIDVETLALLERRAIEKSIQKSQWILITSILAIGLSIWGVGQLLKKAVVIPLRKLESSLLPIAQGTFNHLEAPSSDREFVAFTDAFNRMLKESMIHQKRMLHSDKLASIGILATGVAHELNNPLSNISSSCQLLIEEITEADPEQLNIWLKQIDDEATRGRNIVRTLLDFGGQRQFHLEQIKLLDIVNETMAIIDKALRDNSSRLSLNIPDKLTVFADKQRLQQLFINVVQNALHAGGHDTKISISAIEHDKGRPTIPDGAEVAGNIKCIQDHKAAFVEVIISDTGPGIAKEDLSKIFDPFFTTKEPGHGVGLGLYIVQEIMKEFDGCLAISSQRGKGTQVTLLLPKYNTDS